MEKVSFPEAEPGRSESDPSHPSSFPRVPILPSALRVQEEWWVPTRVAGGTSGGVCGTADGPAGFRTHLQEEMRKRRRTRCWTGTNVHLQNFFAVGLTKFSRFRNTGCTPPPKNLLCLVLFLFPVLHSGLAVEVLSHNIQTNVVCLGMLHGPGLPLAYCALARGFISAERINAKY